jgi:hypothetical protein
MGRGSAKEAGPGAIIFVTAASADPKAAAKASAPTAAAGISFSTLVPLARNGLMRHPPAFSIECAVVFGLDLTQDPGAFSCAVGIAQRPARLRLADGHLRFLQFDDNAQIVGCVA